MVAVVGVVLVVRVEIWLLEAQVEQAGLEHRHQSRVQRLQEHGVVLAAVLITWEQPLREVKETGTAQAQGPILEVAATEQQKQGLGLLAVQAALALSLSRFLTPARQLFQAVLHPRYQLRYQDLRFTQ
jgi:hypothetical protein